MGPKAPCDVIIFTVELCVIIMTMGTILFTCCVLHNVKKQPCIIIDHDQSSNNSDNSSDASPVDRTYPEKDSSAIHGHHHGIKTISWSKLLQKVMWENDMKFDDNWIVAVLYAGVPIIVGIVVLFIVFCAIHLFEFITRRCRKAYDEFVV